MRVGQQGARRKGNSPSVQRKRPGDQIIKKEHQTIDPEQNPQQVHRLCLPEKRFEIEINTGNRQGQAPELWQ